MKHVWYEASRADVLKRVLVSRYVLERTSPYDSLDLKLSQRTV